MGGGGGGEGSLSDFSKESAMHAGMNLGLRIQVPNNPKP